MLPRIEARNSTSPLNSPLGVTRSSRRQVYGFVFHRTKFRNVFEANAYDSAQGIRLDPDFLYMDA